jgi:hypothetical protein
MRNGDSRRETGASVTFPAGQEDLANVCPYLGLADDSDSHATYPTEAHRCYRLENPTRIATGHQETYCLGANHVTCPVFRGEGIGATSRPAAGGAAAAAATRGDGELPRGRAPRQPREGAFGGRREPAGAARGGGGRSPALERKRPAGTLGPRPRAGGVSMPIATIGLFAFAMAILALAFLINRAVGGDDDDGALSQADRSASQFARTATESGGSGNETPTNDQTPGNNQTPNGNATTPAGGATATPGNGGSDTYTVVAGDNCGIIANKHSLTLEQFFDLNPDIDESCQNLNIGDEVRVR